MITFAVFFCLFNALAAQRQPASDYIPHSARNLKNAFLIADPEVIDMNLVRQTKTRRAVTAGNYHFVASGSSKLVETSIKKTYQSTVARYGPENNIKNVVE
jgi:hypothetical protein